MWKLYRYINKNFVKIIIIIIVVIFLLSMIAIINNLSGESRKRKNEDVIENQIAKNNLNNTYENESKSMVSQGDMSIEKQKSLGETVDSFLKYCINGDYQNAYNLLSSDCKTVLYPNLDLFIQSYCDKFSGNKQYSFQSWTSKNSYIYYVKIFDNMLSTGKDYNSYVEEYISVVSENQEYKVNVNGFLGKKDINKSAEKNNIKINVLESDIYMNYQTFKVKIENYTDYTIMLDSLEDVNSVYVVDNNQAKFESLLSELNKEDLIVNSNKYKILDIKFSNKYRDDVSIDKIVFNSVIPNYDKYLENKNSYDEKISIEINLQ